MKGLAIACLLFAVSPVIAQERVKPKAAKGGNAFGEPWAEVPGEYKKLRIPEWSVPTDLKKWETDRLEVRRTLLKCLGDLPKRPDPAKVIPTFKEERADYTIERFEFHNGVDQTVHGVLLIPKGA